VSPELLGSAAALTLFTVAATIHAHRTRYSRPVVETTPTAGRGTKRLRRRMTDEEAMERASARIDAALGRIDAAARKVAADEGVTLQCWTPGSSGNHAYASRVGGGWECMRCGDQVTP
jgi:hypothetical protein